MIRDEIMERSRKGPGISVLGTLEKMHCFATWIEKQEILISKNASRWAGMSDRRQCAWVGCRGGLMAVQWVARVGVVGGMIAGEMGMWLNE